MVIATPARPFTKWAGGKRSLLHEILPRVPDMFTRYYEPFAGGGAVFFALTEAYRAHGERPFASNINDTNVRLMRTYAAIKDDVGSVIRKLARLKNDEETFLRMRKKTTDKMTGSEVAAWFIYLNKTCFNGLYRVNKKNEFNVPFGKMKNPKICDEENLRAASYALQQSVITSLDFTRATTRASKGDFIFYDPPYLPRNETDFVAYGVDHFGLEDHVRLRDLALEQKKKGVRIMITNSGSDVVRKLYGGRSFKIFETQGKRSVGAAASTRGKMPDLLIT